MEKRHSVFKNLIPESGMTKSHIVGLTALILVTLALPITVWVAQQQQELRQQAQTTGNIRVGFNVTAITHYPYKDINPYADASQVDEVLAEMQRMGVKEVRVFAANKNISDDEAANRLNQFLTKAQNYDIKVIASLIDFYGSGFSPQGTEKFYTGNFNGIPLLNDEFFTSGYKERYLPFVRTVVEKNKNHPNLYMWEVGNELKNDASPQRFISFMKDVTNTINSISPNQLISTGMINAGHASLTPDQLYPQLPYVDVVSVHSYNRDHGGQADAQWARANNKPLYIGEIGFSGTGDRTNDMKNELQFWKDQGATFALQWGLIPEGLEDNGNGDRDVGMDDIWHTDYDNLAKLFQQLNGVSVTNPAPTARISPSQSPAQLCPTGGVVPNVTPNPLACDDNIGNQPSLSLAKNTMLTQGMDDWTPFDSGNVEVSYNGSGYTPFGGNIQISGNGNFTGGVYQTLSNLKPGTWYNAFYATAQEMWGPGNVKDGGASTKREVGIDPTGGTNWQATNIMWGRSVGGDRQNYGGWKTVEVGNSPLVSFQATGTTATMFAKVSGSDDNARSNTWIDGLFFIEACESGNNGTAPTCTPAPTNAPGTQPTVIPSGPVTTPPPAQPTPIVTLPGSCSVAVNGQNTSNSGFNTVTVSVNGFGGDVYLQMGQKGTTQGDITNSYNKNGFFSPNSLKAFSPVDEAKIQGLQPNEYGRLGTDFESNVVKVNNAFTIFSAYEWDKKYKKTPQIPNTSTNIQDFLTGKDRAFWYYISGCQANRQTGCEVKNITVQIPKETNVWFFCSVRQQQGPLVCSGNPMCEYNNGPDVGVQQNSACLAWKRSCSNQDYFGFPADITNAQNNGQGFLLDHFLPQ